jgi:hypothetical protein
VAYTRFDPSVLNLVKGAGETREIQKALFEYTCLYGSELEHAPAVARHRLGPEAAAAVEQEARKPVVQPVNVPHKTAAPADPTPDPVTLDWL